MHVAARRPYLAAGVAFVGAGAIAMSAVTPMPDVHLPSVDLPSVHVADLHLTALANPFEVYAQVFQTALANVNTLAENTVPGQLLNQLLTNQVSSASALLSGLSTTGGGIAAAANQIPAALTTAVGQLAAGNVSGAVNTLLGVPLAIAAPATALVPALQTVLTQPLVNLVNVINTLTRDPLATLLTVSGFIAPLISVPAAAATAIQNVLNAFGTGDLGAVANAIVTAPATIADGLLNGGYGPDLGSLAGIPPGSGISVVAGGLLNSSGSSFDPVTGNFVINTGGPLYALQQVIKMITDAITPPAVPAVAATAAVTSIPTASAATITLASTAPVSLPEKTATVAAPDTGTTADGSKDTTVSKPSTAKDGGESEVATKDSVTKDETTKDTSESTSPSPSKKPTESDPDVTTGNKVEPKSPTSEPTKSGDSVTSATPDKGAAASSEQGAEKSAAKDGAAAAA